MNKKFYAIGGLIMLVMLGVAYVMSGGVETEEDQAAPTEQSQPSQGIRIN